MAEEPEKPDKSEIPGWIRGIHFLYTRLVLLDFVGRIAPGAAALTAVLLFFADGSPECVDTVVSSHAPASVWGWLPIIAFIWLIGFALDGFARFVRYARPEVPAGLPPDVWARTLVLFDRNASDPERMRSERFYLVSQAAATGGIALLLVAAAMFLRPFREIYDIRLRLLMLALFIAAAWSLRFVHCDYLSRWHRYVRAVLPDDSTTSRSAASEERTFTYLTVSTRPTKAEDET